MKYSLLLSTAVVGALAFMCQPAKSCSSSNGGLGHLSTTQTTSGESSCIFNVDVSMDQPLTDVGGSVSGVLQEIETALTGQGDGSAINVDDGGEGQVSFTVPQDAGQVVITVTDANGQDASGTMDLSSGSFQPASSGGGGCTPPTPQSLPVNGMPPEANQPVQSDSQPDVSDSLGSGVPAGDDWAPSGKNAKDLRVQ